MSCRLNQHDQLGRFCVYGIYKRTLRAPTKENALVLIAVTLQARTDRSRTRLESETPLQQVQRSATVGGHPREVRWTVLPVRERTLSAETQEKHLLFLCFDLFCRFFQIFLFFFFPSSPPSVVVVDFIGTMKSN